ncbi:MAG: UDP-N-acetylmuramoylalanine--D-glutamate ligase [Saprospiraceae bacterium]|nr:MAG: UDP-N-acetylmuramoylalanine--D-glutamate ligase [Saprospiraceae bacterium]
MQGEIVVLGSGESGVGAAILAKQKGWKVFVSDKGKIKDSYKEELEKYGIPYEEGQHDEYRILQAREIIKSPGIPERVSLVQSLLKKNIPVISEIEFAARYSQSTLIGITGSNGKTTTTKLLFHLLKTAGINVGMAGNVGYSFARYVAESKVDVMVLELSSFQLDGIVDFRPHYSILLNITPDHLDRYEYQMANYIRSKFRVALNQTEVDYFFYYAEDKHIRDYLASHQLTVNQVGISTSMVEDSVLTLGGETFDLQHTQLRGVHNALNALFAISVAQKLGVSATSIREGLAEFKPVEHRLEPVAEIEGVEYINDSKATNVDSVYYALQAMKKPVIWIVGGQDKGNDYEPLFDLVREKVKALICLGVDNRKLQETFGPFGLRIEEVQSADAAVRLGQQLAKKGDVVLLSPACASFDLFKNYEDRGNQFREAVLNLKKEK